MGTSKTKSNLTVRAYKCEEEKCYFNLIEVELNDTDYDIFSISETFLTSLAADDPLAVDGFTFVRNDREGKWGGGIGIYGKSTYPVKIIKI